jgi:hypothetical protein
MATEQAELASVSFAAFIANKNQIGNPPPTLSCSEATCVIGSTQSLPSTIALASRVLLRKRKNLTDRPPAGRARSLRPRRRSGADGRTSLQSFSARGRLGSRKQWRAPIFPRSTPCLPVVPCKAISILSKNSKKTRVAEPAALKRPVVPLCV